MQTIVVKFGGSSLADRGKLLRAAGIIADIARRGDRVAAVVSAQGRTTDRLIARMKEITDHPSEREADLLLSTGELASASLVAMAVCSLGVPAVALSGGGAGIRTTEEHGDARICSVDTGAIEEQFSRGMAVVVAGFQGVSGCGEVTTLGRGGSDTTAVALAAALGASVCRIYTDVDGVYTADPNKVAGARKLGEVGSGDMLELACLGARVLHGRSVELAQKYGVAVEVLSSRSGAPGTLVRPGVREGVSIGGIAKDGDVAAVTISGIEPGCAAACRVVSLVAQRQIPNALVVPSPPAQGRQLLSLTVPIRELQAAVRAAEEAVRGTGWEVSVCESAAKVSVVGAGLRSRGTAIARLLAVLMAEGIEVRSVSGGESRITALVDRRSADRAVEALHEAFFGDEEG